MSRKFVPRTSLKILAFRHKMAIFAFYFQEKWMKSPAKTNSFFMSDALLCYWDTNNRLTSEWKKQANE
ncbi:MAG: hypothetical protein CMF71_02600 [Magnetovibrio sp.]|nr:hypothetical protein [Magnetovibrio sp.]